MATSSSLSWKKTIFQRLKERNKKETHGFASLIESYNKTFEQATALKHKNVALTVEVEKLREENLSLQIKADSGGGGGGTGSRELEQKLYKLQEELTEQLRRRGENAQQIIDLSNTLKDKEKDLQVQESRLMDSLANEHCLKVEMKRLESTIFELEATNQTLKDEHQALQMAFASLESKYMKVQEDNGELMARWLDLKGREADKVNEENDKFYKHKQQKLQKELAEAAKESPIITVDVDDGAGLPVFTPMCLSASLPSRVCSKIDAHDGEVNAVLWSPTGNIFATGGSDRKIKLWQYHSGECLNRGTLLGSNAGITALEFDPEETLVLGASNDYASRLWSLSDHRLRHTLTGHSGKVLSAKFLGDSSKVVSGSNDRTLKIWDLHSKACTKTIFAGSSCFDLVTLHGTHIVSGHFDKRVRFWDSRSEKTNNEIGLQGRITSLALSPDRSSLLVCARDDTLKVIDLRMNQVSQTLCAENFKVAYDWSRAVFSPDGAYAMAGSSDGSVYVWNILKTKVEKILKEHSHAVIACSWHPAGSYILSCEKQKKVVVWSDI